MVIIKLTKNPKMEPQKDTKKLRDLQFVLEITYAIT